MVGGYSMSTKLWKKRNFACSVHHASKNNFFRPTPQRSMATGPWCRVRRILAGTGGTVFTAFIITTSWYTGESMVSSGDDLILSECLGGNGDQAAVILQSTAKSKVSIKERLL